MIFLRYFKTAEEQYQAAAKLADGIAATRLIALVDIAAVEGKLAADERGTSRKTRASASALSGTSRESPPP